MTEERKLKLREYRRKYRALHPDRVRASCAKYSATHRESLNDARKKRLAENPRRRVRRRDPEKDHARSAVDYAIRSGRLVRPSSCEYCGAMGRVEGHHADYSKPLEVIWLCRICHMKIEGKVTYDHLRQASNCTLLEAQ